MKMKRINEQETPDFTTYDEKGLAKAFIKLEDKVKKMNDKIDQLSTDMALMMKITKKKNKYKK